MPTANQQIPLTGYQMQGTYTPGTTGVEVRLGDNGVWSAATLTPAGTWQYDIQPGYAAGQLDLFIRALNRFGVPTHPNRTRVNAA
jgi:hypothetical protein